MTVFTRRGVFGLVAALSPATVVAETAWLVPYRQEEIR